MTKREVLTNIVSAYIQGTGKFPLLDSKGNLNETWYKTVDAICNKYPEEDKTEIRMMSVEEYEACNCKGVADTSCTIDAKTYDRGYAY